MLLSEEATNTNFIVFGLTRPGLEITIYRTWDEHANHYATDALLIRYVPNFKNCIYHKYFHLLQKREGRTSDKL